MIVRYRDELVTKELSQISFVKIEGGELIAYHWNKAPPPEYTVFTNTTIPLKNVIGVYTNKTTVERNKNV